MNSLIIVEGAHDLEIVARLLPPDFKKCRT